MKNKMKDKLWKLALDMDKNFGQPLSVGKITKHPDGRTVKIKSGCFRDPIFNRVSNWWTWNEIFPDGSFGPDESGYGWSDS
jgi:hypothetical protein